MLRITCPSSTVPGAFLGRMIETMAVVRLSRRRNVAKIIAAVGADPDQAPVRTEATMECARRDVHGVPRLPLGIGQIEFANRYRLALGTLRNWEQGRSEPDRSAKVLLAAISADPDGEAAAATRAGNPGYLTAGPRQAA